MVKNQNNYQSFESIYYNIVLNIIIPVCKMKNNEKKASVKQTKKAQYTI